MSEKLKFPKIVIVGGGAGGLVLASLLGRKLGKKKQAKITLVDEQLTHIWKPLLHEVAAGSLNPYQDELNYFAQGKHNHFSFQPGRLIALDREDKTITLDDLQDELGEQVFPARKIHYDYLVLAIGSVANDFSTPGAKEHCIYLDTRSQAERFHRTFLSYYYRAKASGDKNDKLDIAIIGAGATGVELAAEVHHAAEVLLHYGLDEIKPTDVKISLIEGAAHVLPALNHHISMAVEEQLEHIGVDVWIGEKVTRVDKQGIYTDGGKFIPAQIKVWSAGVKAPKVLNDLAGLAVEKNNRLKIDEFLRTEDPFIFALGDCAHCTAKDSKGEALIVPPRAQSAYLQAKWLAKNMSKLIEGKTVKPFIYHDYGSLIPLSSRTAVGQLMGNLTGSVNIEGFIARKAYLFLYRKHQAALYGWPKMLVFVLKDWLSHSSGPKMKMH